VIGRREFITLLGGAAAWPIAASAQQPTLPTIGYLQNFTSKLSERSSLAFLAGLKEMGYIEGQNLRIERRVAEANDRLSVLALELINHGVAAIFAFSLTAATAAKTATETTPIVFVGAGDPVRIGLVALYSKSYESLRHLVRYRASSIETDDYSIIRRNGPIIELHVFVYRILPAFQSIHRPEI